MSTIAMVAGRDSIMFSINGTPKTVPKTDLHYAEIVDALKRGDKDEVERLLTRHPKQLIADMTDGLLTFKDGKLWFDGDVLNTGLTRRIIDLKKDGYDITPLTNFLRNLLDNPSKRAVDELYGFLEKCDLPITADGHFIAYKMVKGDFTDIYTGTMDNSVGATVKMRRNAVDEEKTRTCSEGLHFASLYYVTSGGYGSRGSGHKLVALKINPRDVVSIPVDYNNSKGRACEYKVIKHLSWDERLPVSAAGFKLADDIAVGGKAAADELLDTDTSADYDDADVDMDEDHDDADAPVLVLTPSGAVAPKSGKYTDADIRRVKQLLKDGLGLTAIQVETGVSRRHVARIRDGEIGQHVKLDDKDVS